MGYIGQVKNISIKTVTQPRIYLKWENTENGRDREQCYERIDNNGYVYYINQFNRSMIIDKSDTFFKIMEDMYNVELEIKP